jgi:hypothetical protein
MLGADLDETTALSLSVEHRDSLGHSSHDVAIARVSSGGQR